MQNKITFRACQTKSGFTNYLLLLDYKRQGNYFVEDWGTEYRMPEFICRKEKYVLSKCFFNNLIDAKHELVKHFNENYEQNNIS